MDDEPLVSRIDGRAVAVDPGMHAFTFHGDDGATATEKVMILQGQHNRALTVSLPASSGARAAPAEEAAEPPAAKPVSAPPPPVPTAELARPRPVRTTPPPPPAPPPSSGSSAAPYLWGTLGLAGVGGYALLTTWGRKDNELLSACAPDCPRASVEHIRKLYLLADVSLGVGVVSLVAATWTAFSGGSTEAKETEKRPRPSGYVVDVHPTPAGAMATVAGRF
jgi:hypothetical protein